jgi:hypothetical protein
MIHIEASLPIHLLALVSLKVTLYIPFKREEVAREARIASMIRWLRKLPEIFSADPFGGSLHICLTLRHIMYPNSYPC